MGARPRDGNHVARLRPGKNDYFAEQQVSNEVAIRRDWLTGGDLFLIADQVNANGTVDLKAYGAVIAQVRKGKVKVKIYKQHRHKDAHRQTVIRMRGTGTIRHLQDGGTVYKGRNIRIRIVDQKFRVQIVGVGIHLSAVAQGQVTLQADPNASDPGVFSIDGDNYQPLPAIATQYQLGS